VMKTSVALFGATSIPPITLPHSRSCCLSRDVVMNCLSVHVRSYV
jgi:hypothetical protein